MRRLACLALAALLPTLPLVVRADEAADTFNGLYAEDLKRVAATASPADDVALARQLVEAAKQVTSQAPFLTLLCEKAHELAMKDISGYPTAKAAMDLLAANVPEKKVESLQRLVAMYQGYYATARGDAKTEAGEALIELLKVIAEAQAAGADTDGAGATLKQALAVATAIKSPSKAAVQAQLAGLGAQQKVEKQIDALKAKLEKDPQDAASLKEIVRLYLVEMDNPKEAAEFVDDRCDEATQKYVPAAARPVTQAPELACKELGDWYRGLADQASAPAVKGAMLRRVKAYYERFMHLHKADDLARAGTTLMLKKVDGALAKLGPTAEDKAGPSSLTLNLGKGVTMRLVRLDAGKVMMGDTGWREVTLSKPFYMGVTEVTQDQYEAVMGVNPSRFKGPPKPVEQVSWKDAMEFCRRLSQKTGKTFRLPTEAEWEYACRAGTTTRFSFGDDVSALDGYAWHKGNSGDTTHPVAQKRPNAWGLYDMQGNVTEWCADWYDKYPPGPATDPQGPPSGDMRIIRGGSAFDGAPSVFQSSNRRTFEPLPGSASNGFRCAMTP